jgi:hypothetical protein
VPLRGTFHWLKGISFFRILALALLFCALAIGAPLPAAEPESKPQFGFTGPEIFPIDNQISQLRAADLDGDGLMDLVVVNNARSKINLLYNQTGKTNTQAQRPFTGRRDINELPPDSRFRVESIASEKRISALAAVDLNSDSRPDLAYYGEPRELIVLLNEGTNQWSVPKRWLIDDVQITPNAMATGDLNGDSRTDLVLLAENHIYALFQDAEGALGEPRKISFSGVSKSVQIVDINGDGREDLLLVNWEDRYPFRFRLQQAGGELGPEIYFPFTPIRSYWADNLEEQNPQTQIITIAQNSGRAQVSEFRRTTAPKLEGDLVQGQLHVVPLLRTDKARRGAVWVDLNHDGLQDLLVSEPESGQLSFYAQSKEGSFSTPSSFPALAGVSDILVEDWDGDGIQEVFMLSPDERQVGVTRMDKQGRLAFPTRVPLAGRPLAFAIGSLDGYPNPVLALIVDQEGRRTLQLQSADGKQAIQKLDEKFRSNPTSLAFHDADQDGRNDLVILTPYERVKVLRRVPGKDFEELDVAAPGGALELPWLSLADVDADGTPELLLTQRNFIRAVVLRQETAADTGTNRGNWNFHVKQQINGAAPNSRLTAAATLPGTTNSPAHLFMLDAERKALSFCRQDTNGTWQIIRNIPLPVSDFDSLQPIAIGGTNHNAVGLAGPNLAAMLPLKGDIWELAQLDGYETPIRNGHLTDVITGDLDNDQRKDLVFLETARNYLDLVIFDKQRRLTPANRWQVFEERTFRGRRAELPEPREALIADLTGDGRNDLAVLVHDRVLLYPQE